MLSRSSARLLAELLLVDDGSTMSHLQARLEREVARLERVRLVRTATRLGLTQARLLGVANSTAPVLVFLDSHCEVNSFVRIVM